MTVITRTADKMSGWMKEELLLKLAELSLTNRTVANWLNIFNSNLY